MGLLSWGSMFTLKRYVPGAISNIIDGGSGASFARWLVKDQGETKLHHELSAIPLDDVFKLVSGRGEWTKPRLAANQLAWNSKSEPERLEVLRRWLIEFLTWREQDAAG